MAGKQDGWGLRKVQALGSQQSLQAALFHRITRGSQLEPQLCKSKSGCWSTAQPAQATSPQTPAQTQGAGWSTLERVPSAERRPGDAGESPPLSGSRSPRGGSNGGTQGTLGPVTPSRSRPAPKPGKSDGLAAQHATRLARRLATTLPAPRRRRTPRSQPPSARPFPGAAPRRLI